MNLGLAAFHLMQKRRAIVARNVRIAWGDKLGKKELQSLTQQVFQTNGANLLGGTRCMLMDDSSLAERFYIYRKSRAVPYSLFVTWVIGRFLPGSRT
jgi:lauroyl/myristoyl acyltransferase